ncbi:MAG: hypothetical protein ACXADH_05705 [Candidatus Kariarchaeaceae archaeon]|jgi:hypothetical protein
MAKLLTDEKIVVILDDLPFSEIFEFKVEEPGPPAIDSRTGTLMLSADLLDPSVHHYGPRNYDSSVYQKRKLEHPWQVELAGTEDQIREFLRIYFPSWNQNRELERSGVWDWESVERAARHAASKDVYFESVRASEQVDKILEARYHREPSALDVHKRYIEFFDNIKTRYFDGVVPIDGDYSEVGDWCTAIIWFWVHDVTLKQAEERVGQFADEHNLPFTRVVAETSKTRDKDRVHLRVFVSLIFDQECKGIGFPDSSIHEAKYDFGKVTKQMRDEVYKLYKKQTYVNWDEMRNREAYIHVIENPLTIFFWYDAKVYTEDEALHTAKRFMADHNLPYTKLVGVQTVHAMDDVAVAFRFGDRDELKEARYAEEMNAEKALAIYRQIREHMIELNKYPYYETLTGARVTNHSTNMTSEYGIVGDEWERFAEMGIQIHDMKNQREANDELSNFISELNIPYNDIEFGVSGDDGKYPYIIQWKDKKLDEAQRMHPKNITVEDVVEVFGIYKQHETPDESPDDPRLFQDMVKDVVAKGWDSVFGDPTSRASFHDAPVHARFTTRWVFEAPKELNKEKEESRLRDFAESLQLPYTKIKVDTHWIDASKASFMLQDDAPSHQLSEAVLIFEVTDK